MTLKKYITAARSDSALIYSDFKRDLCSVRYCDSTGILKTGTELSFLIEYICTI